MIEFKLKPTFATVDSCFDLVGSRQYGVASYMKYSVQDCLRRTMALQEAMFAMQITSDLLSHARLARKKNVSGTKIL